MAHRNPDSIIKLNLTSQMQVSGTGWGLYANEDISARDPIVSIQQPLVVSLDIPRLKDTCYCCLGYSNVVSYKPEYYLCQQGKKLQICKGCHLVRYCSKHCQSHSWKAVHKYECNLFARLYPNILPNNVRAIIQILLLRKAQKLVPGEWQDFMVLESHLDEWKQRGGQTWEDIGLMARGTKEYSGTDLKEETLCEIFGKLLVNCFTMVSPYYDPLGLALHPLAALANHSCNYNAVVCFDYLAPYHTLSIRALRPIARGEQIVISYVEATNPRHVRQKELQDRYFFACECSKCSSELIKNQEMPGSLTPHDHLLIEQRAFELLTAAQKDTSISGPIQKLQYGIHILQKTASWPLHRQPLAALRQQLIVSFIAADQFNLAFLHAWIQYRWIDEIIMPEKHHPIRLVHEWLVLVLLRYIESEKLCSKRDYPVQKYRLSGRSIKFHTIHYYVLHQLYHKTKAREIGDIFAIMVRILYNCHGDSWRWGPQGIPKQEFLTEADKLTVCTNEILEQELVWGDSRAS